LLIPLQGGYIVASISDVFSNGIGTGLLVAGGVALLGPVVIPAVAMVVKPVAKTAIKGGAMLYGWGRETVAEIGEYAGDTYAEAMAEANGEVYESPKRGPGRPRKTA
jgi:Protein of unknown function (DUF5132)